MDRRLSRRIGRKTIDMGSLQLGLSDALMNVMDRINRNFGKGTIRLLGEGAALHADAVFACLM